MTLLVSPDAFDTVLPWFRESLKGVTFVQGEDYASYTSGDHVAEYGLAALVTGGAVAVAAKSGLLARFWKLILLGLAGLGGLLKRLFGRADVVSSDER